jgi:ATP-dependent helicase/nuclease subunit A
MIEAQLLAQRLIELEVSGFPVWDKERGGYRPFRFGDAAILFRATTSLPLYEEQFKAAGLPYLTVSGRGYFDRPEVRDLVALLSALHNPSDDLNLAVALRSPLFGFSDESLYRLRWHDSQGSPAGKAISYAAALKAPPPTDQAENIHFAAQVLEDLWPLAGRVDPWRLLRSALDLTGYEAALALSDGDSAGSGRSRNNVLKLLEMAQQRSTESLAVFLNGLRDLSAREAREGEALGSAPESGAVMLLSIHAAKGLEFPVVVVADLGRRSDRAGSPPLILHDPEVGLVCRQRDGNGDWQKPASYAWGEWLIRRMETAENKRLLYVACTRAADLLLLSGKSGEQNSWLSQIISTWLVDPAAELQQFDGFSVRVVRPSAPPVQEPVAGSAGEPVLAMTTLPELVQQLPVDLRERHYAVTHLQRALLAESEADPAIPYPAVRISSRTVGSVQPPQYLVGRIVHRLLANWDNLSLSAATLEERLAAFARRERITHPEALRQTVQRSLGMLAVFRRAEIFSEVDTAVQRHTEIPFSLSASLGHLHGVIDLLYQDRAGNWHLVDWKTEWFPPVQLPEQSRKHCQQIAIYERAVRQILGVKPDVRVCFLAVQAWTYRFTPDELEKSLADLF